MEHDGHWFMESKNSGSFFGELWRPLRLNSSGAVRLRSFLMLWENSGEQRVQSAVHAQGIGSTAYDNPWHKRKMNGR